MKKPHPDTLHQKCGYRVLTSRDELIEERASVPALLLIDQVADAEG